MTGSALHQSSVEPVDPSKAKRRSQPRTVQDLYVAAKNSWLLIFDNLSYIDPALSDAFCQLSTGGAMTTRALYTDDDENIISFKRRVILNGIDDFVRRADMLERALIVNLPTIPEEKRRPEGSFWRDFEQAAPRILGAILTAVSTGLRNLPDVRLERTPRMADFALFATACEEGLGFEKGAFMAAYNSNREDANQLAITASPVAQAILKLMSDRETWKGTPTDLYEKLNELVGPDKPARYWPQNAQKLSDMIKRVSPNLKAMGIEVSRGKEDRNTRFMKFRKLSE